VAKEVKQTDLYKILLYRKQQRISRAHIHHVIMLF